MKDRMYASMLSHSNTISINTIGNPNIDQNPDSMVNPKSMNEDGFGFSATVGFFQSQGIPSTVAFLVILAESFGALGLILGFATKLSALGIALTMTGAGIFVRANGFFMNWFNTQAGEGFEYHLLAIAMSLVLLSEGGGAMSLDGFILQKIK